jgi:hypothetical protein
MQNGRRAALCLLPSAFCLLLACGGGGAKEKQVSREPISVRGWIVDVEQPPSNTFRTVETEAARKYQLFSETNVWVDGAPYVSGGVAENGAFILLDVPPGKTIISFSAPGVAAAKLVLDRMPGNVDVVVPGLLLKRDGGVELTEPGSVQVRMAAQVPKPVPTKQTAIVAGRVYPVTDTPLNSMVDRRDFPNPPPTSAPLATVK